jgi:hypothetical protein
MKPARPTATGDLFLPTRLRRAFDITMVAPVFSISSPIIVADTIIIAK